jgi:1,2-dihydroxy-3-keto-5-methylthiopentene dioxygenase
MSQLCLYSDAAVEQPEALLNTRDPAIIAAELQKRGLEFQQWQARSTATAGASQAEILSCYEPEIARVQAGGGYATVDVIQMTADHPDREALRQKFLQEHTHAEAEVRFFVEGRGLFCLHIGKEVVQVLCEANDWLSVPAGTRHWFDMGAEPHFTALRFFNNSEGWVAQFTGDPIADRYPRLAD